jgi:small subunit ribosomal protein S2
MSSVSQEQLLEAGCHFGHLTRKWNPKMAPYIFMEQDGIHIIDLNKTAIKLDEASSAVRNMVKSGRKILFVATKKQAKEIIREIADKANMPHATERWLGGMLTNFSTVRKSIKKMQTIEKMSTDGTYANINKKEKLMLEREKAKLAKVLGGISDMSRLPSALFIVDVKREHLAVAEALKLNIPTIAMVDTNSDPSNIDFPIPCNDDSSKSIKLIVETIAKAIEEGQLDRKKEKDSAEIEKAKAEKENASEASK